MYPFATGFYPIMGSHVPMMYIPACHPPPQVLNMGFRTGLLVQAMLVGLATNLLSGQLSSTTMLLGLRSNNLCPCLLVLLVSYPQSMRKSRRRLLTSRRPPPLGNCHLLSGEMPKMSGCLPRRATRPSSRIHTSFSAPNRKSVLASCIAALGCALVVVLVVSVVLGAAVLIVLISNGPDSDCLCLYFK